MSTTKTIPPRSEVPAEHTWDLAPLYKSDAAWQRGLKKLEKMAGEYGQFRGKLGRSAKMLRRCLEFDIEVEKLAERLQSYAFLKSAEDVSNSSSQAMVARFMNVATRASEAASYIAPEIQAIPRKKMNEFLKSPELEDYRFTLQKLLRFRPHILSEAEERLLAMQGEVAETPDRVFSQLNDADFSFGMVTDEKGNDVELTQSSFRTLLESPRRTVRKTAFHQFYDVYEGHRNALAATLNGSMLQDVYVARARKYPSALEAALFRDRVPVSVYDSLIEAVHKNLPTVHRYLDLRKKALRLKDLHMYDTYVPIVKPAETGMPYEDGVAAVCEALEPLGSAYVKPLREGLLHKRWVDRYENKGKRSGAFSAGGYVGPPYILMNYQDTVIDSVFTLAHEAGHSMHTYLSARNQPFHYYQYTIFVAEVASTFNEQFLNRYLLDRATDKKTRAYLISREIDEIRGTIVRQTMFAEFEKRAHELVEQGEALTVDAVRALYRELLDRYFGDSMVVDDALSLECLRIPHFYSAFYVYKYATGLSAAIALSERVMNGGDTERRQYLNFLKSGGSDYPLNLLKKAGVDMTQPEPVDAAMARLEELVEQLEGLV